MTNKPTIDGVSQELLRRMLTEPNPSASYGLLQDRAELRALLAALVVELQAEIERQAELLREVVDDVHFVIASDTRQRINACLDATSALNGEPK